MSDTIKTLSELSNQIDQYIKSFGKDYKLDLKEIESIVKRYQGEDWLNYRPCQNCKKCFLTQNYYRRMPIKLPCLHDKDYDFYLLVWKSGVETGIHDHPRNGCILKVLEGQIHEDRYSKEGHIIESSNLEKDAIGYMHDRIGYHKVSNETDQTAYSLHIYSPPKYIPRVYNLDDLGSNHCHVKQD